MKNESPTSGRGPPRPHHLHPMRRYTCFLPYTPCRTPERCTTQVKSYIVRFLPYLDDQVAVIAGDGGVGALQGVGRGVGGGGELHGIAQVDHLRGSKRRETQRPWGPRSMHVSSAELPGCAVVAGRPAGKGAHTASVPLRIAPPRPSVQAPPLLLLPLPPPLPLLLSLPFLSQLPLPLPLPPPLPLPLRLGPTVPRPLHTLGREGSAGARPVLDARADWVVGRPSSGGWYQRYARGLRQRTARKLGVPPGQRAGCRTHAVATRPRRHCRSSLCCSS